MNKNAKNSAGNRIRFNQAERHQHEFRDICLDELVSGIEGHKGRSAVDPRILLTLWLFAIIEGISSGRRLAKLCKRDAVYMWICGNVGVNYNLLNAFRVQHSDALQDIMSQTLATLQHHDLIEFNRISQDGIRVRANAGKSSFRRKATLKDLLRQARDKVKRVLSELDESSSEQQQAAQIEAAEDRQRRVQAALAEYEELSTSREKRKKGEGEKTRVSTTDPEARNMKMADGGFRPAYNIQTSTLNGSRIIVDVCSTNSGTDSGQMEPMLDRVEAHFGKRPKEILADGGYNSRDDVTKVEARGTKVFSPVRAARGSDRDPHEPRRGDSDQVKQWRQRMKTPEAQQIFQERGETAEFPFARFRNHGLCQVPVRGLKKVQTIGVWHALVHNFMEILFRGWLPKFTK